MAGSCVWGQGWGETLALHSIDFWYVLDFIACIFAYSKVINRIKDAVPGRWCTLRMGTLPSNSQLPGFRAAFRRTVPQNSRAVGKHSSATQELGNGPGKTGF